MCVLVENLSGESLWICVKSGVCGSEESLGQKSEVVVVESLGVWFSEDFGTKAGRKPQTHCQVRPVGHAAAAHDDDDDDDDDNDCDDDDDDDDDNDCNDDDDDGYNDKNLSGKQKILLSL